MRWPYFRTLITRAARQAWCAVIARTWPDLAKKIVIALMVIAVLYWGIERIDPRNDAYDDQVVIVQAVLLATIVAASGLFIINLVFVAPYQLWREEKERADAAEAAAIPQGEAEDHRASRLLDESRAKEAASVRAKAEKMLERLATRRHSMMEAGRSAQHDSHLAAMWDAEQRGEIYDELHRSTFRPVGSSGAENKEAERVRAEIKAKADAMKRRHYSRNMSVPGLTDDQLAAMWDDEQNGVAVDRFGFRIRPKD